MWRGFFIMGINQSSCINHRNTPPEHLSTQLRQGLAQTPELRLIKDINHGNNASVPFCQLIEYQKDLQKHV